MVFCNDVCSILKVAKHLFTNAPIALLNTRRLICCLQQSTKIFAIIRSSYCHNATNKYFILINILVVGHKINYIPII